MPGRSGVISGDLTPECAAVVTAVLESLSAPMGAEDIRSREQRYHDALAEAMCRLVAADLLPERAGQPTAVPPASRNASSYAVIIIRS